MKGELLKSRCITKWETFDTNPHTVTWDSSKSNYVTVNNSNSKKWSVWLELITSSVDCGVRKVWRGGGRGGVCVQLERCCAWTGNIPVPLDGLHWLPSIHLLLTTGLDVGRDCQKIQSRCENKIFALPMWQFTRIHWKRPLAICS